MAARRGFKLLPPRFAQSWEIHAGLLFLGFFLWGLPGAGARTLVEAAGALSAFLILYFAAYWLNGVRVLLPVGGMVLIGSVLISENAGASVFFAYAAAVSCLLMAPPWSVPVTIAILASFLTLAKAAGYEPGYFAMNSLVIIAVAAIHFQVRRGENVTARLQLREEELAYVHKLAERRRIALDLHDHLGSALSLIAVKAELARRLDDEGIAGVGSELRDIADTARTTLNDVRNVIGDYRVTAFEGELRRARLLLRSGGVSVDVDVVDETGLDPTSESMLAMILCEATTNVVRHARARSCRIRTVRRDGAVTLEIVDDGCGARDYDGHGVRGMRERAARINATFSIVRANGTAVRVDIPAIAVASLPGTASPA